MHGGCSVGVVVPCYNEERQIGKVLETMPDFVDHIIVVDDRSSDATLERSREWQDKMGPRLTVIEQPKNQGVGAANRSEVLVRGLGNDLKFRGADHTCNGVRMGIDGWIYIAVGDFGFHDAVGKDGKKLTMLGGGIYPGMITATIGTVLLIAVVATSIVIVKRRLRYEWWYAVHLLAYAGIALAWFHQIPTGNELVLNTIAADYWRALYVATIVLLVGFRFGAPAIAAFRYRLRVAAVVDEGPGVVSLWITGRGLHRLHARSGQFFLWRFLTRDRWWKAHPFSLSAAPDGRSLRITVKALGDDTARIGEIPVGTRVVAEGPFGVFTEASRRLEQVLLIAGGIGITPVRALMQQMRGNVVVLYRVVNDDDIVFRSELDELARASGADLHYVVGDHSTDEGRRHLSPEHLLELVPDITTREVYVCGPPALIDIVTRHVREAGVPRRHLHAERFAL